MALLHRLAQAAGEQGWRLAVGHVDHGLRVDSSQDAEFVHGLAQGLGLPFAQRRVRVPAGGDSPEQAARAARRRALLALALEQGCPLIALGHTADDQAETVLARLLAGTGPSGLAAMRVWTGPWWRPLLGQSRQALRDWLASQGLAWRDDPSNQDLAPQRNRVRHELLPLARERINPRTDEALGRLAALCAREEDYWQHLCAQSFALWGREEGTSLWLEGQRLVACHPALQARLLRWLVERLTGQGQNLQERHVAQLMDLAAGPAGRKLTLPGGIMAWREAAGLRLDSDEDPPDFTVRLAGPGRVELPHLGRWLKVELARPGELAAREGVTWLPAGRVRWPLVIRPAQPGERIHPLGAPGSKKLARVLMDRKLPAWWRRRVVILADQEGIWWAGPWVSCERARAGKGEEEGEWLKVEMGEG